MLAGRREDQAVAATKTRRRAIPAWL